MRFGSVCSGIEGASQAWNPLGWQCEFVSEIDPFACAVLEARHAGVANRGDMNGFRQWPDSNIDVLIGGTPCQSFSVAGLRGGLDDPRGNLMLTYLAIAARYKPRWLVWENVPGVLSSNKGKDFGALLGGLAELGYGFAYRVLDAQYFNLAQRRQRVFVVGCLGSWRRAAAVLFERASLRGDLAPSRETKEDIASAVTSGSRKSDRGTDVNLVAGTINANGGRQRIDDTYVTHTLRADGFDASEDGSGRGIPLIAVASPLSAGNNANSNAAGRRREDDVNLVYVQTLADPLVAGEQRTYTHEGEHNFRTRNVMAYAVAFAQNSRSEVREMEVTGAVATEPGVQQQTYISGRSGVRRLTPLECERLMGCEDYYTRVYYRGKLATDSPRYKALGNSFPIPVINWLGRRIQSVDSIP